jgi:hypothetical protein
MKIIVNTQKIVYFLETPFVFKKNTTNPLLYTKNSITYQNFSKLIFSIYQKNNDDPFQIFSYNFTRLVSI